jgi:hypothetical protein
MYFVHSVGIKPSTIAKSETCLLLRNLFGYFSTHNSASRNAQYRLILPDLTLILNLPQIWTTLEKIRLKRYEMATIFTDPSRRSIF